MRTRIVQPKIGDAKTISKFLWFPLTIKGERRWLERVTYEIRYDYDRPSIYIDFVQYLHVGFIASGLIKKYVYKIEGDDFYGE